MTWYTSATRRCVRRDGRRRFREDGLTATKLGADAVDRLQIVKRLPPSADDCPSEVQLTRSLVARNGAAPICRLPRSYAGRAAVTFSSMKKNIKPMAGLRVAGVSFKGGGSLNVRHTLLPVRRCSPESTHQPEARFRAWQSMLFSRHKLQKFLITQFCWQSILGSW